MNVKQAKDYIKNAVKLYLKKDEFGEYRVPVVRQRPIFLLGAPGIGKTAIMEQIAQEMGIALVSYSMTHHTRQSALGLPFITQKEYGGVSYSVSEYTMSEIIASIYDTMEGSGWREGILFLDEINCVSETLAPAMLQFLQYKIFGRHRVPEGWIIVTAGNPPEYNKSVREFDVVTLDRLKVLEVEPDYEVWKEYAYGKRIHNAVLSYLELKKERFYHMEMTAKGRSYVTARGWEDLSEILTLYEEENLSVDEALVGQYLRSEKIVKEFTAYYDLYQKYKRDYQINDILAGAASPRVIEKARGASFDERLSLLGMLMDRVLSDMKEVVGKKVYLEELRHPLKSLGTLAAEGSEEEFLGQMEKQAQGRRTLLEKQRTANSLSEEDRKKHRQIISFLEECQKALAMGEGAGGSAYGLVKEKYNGEVIRLKQGTEKVQAMLHALFVFVEEAFGQGNEMLVLVTELTVDSAGAQFIAAFGSPDYSRYSQELMLSERRDSIREQIEELALGQDKEVRE